jgi:dTDP-4-amino-4,6-dideoxygalactose transaminase
VFCEIDIGTRNVTAETVAAALTPQTEAVIVVHYGGQPCRMDDIVSLCERRGLFLIEDSAETIGAAWKGRQAGSFGVGCFSFFPTKNITTGEGGMLTCRDGHFAEKARALISHGISTTTLAREKIERPWLRAADSAGHNYRLSNILAAIGFHQLQRLSELNAKRIELAKHYDSRLSKLSSILTPQVAQGATHVYQMYTIRVPLEKRDPTVRRLRERGIGASVHFDPPVHLQTFYLDKGSRELKLPVTERLSKEIVTLPLYPDMTRNEQNAVIEGLSDIHGNWAEEDRR